jgi:hypothetical protein
MIKMMRILRRMTPNPSRILPASIDYIKLITIHVGKPKGHMRDAVKVAPEKVRRLSLSGRQVAKATSSHGADVIR